jgi:PIN domain nuclease of toxin-antitoxin system
MKYLLDTHALVWSLMNQARLSVRARKIIENTKYEFWVSSISAWEIMRLCEQGRLKLKSSPQTWIESVFSTTPIQEAPINRTIAIESRRVKLPHEDAADRFIVATAIAYGLTLITADSLILKSGACKTFDPS